MHYVLNSDILLLSYHSMFKDDSKPQE